MSVLHNNGGALVPQSRQRNGSYRLPIEARAALAVDLIENGGWSLKDAAAALCVNRTYLMLARHLDDADRLRLADGKLKLAKVYRDYCQRIAEQRAQQEQAEREAARVTVDAAVAAWRGWSPGQRIAFGQGTGIAALWDGSIVPVMDAERGESQRVQITN